VNGYTIDAAGTATKPRFHKLIVYQATNSYVLKAISIYPIGFFKLGSVIPTDVS
jgi:hypothetical protein